MPLIQEIWIINDKGVILFNLQLDGNPIRKELLGGFISVLEQMTGLLEKAEMKSVILGTVRITLGPIGFAGMLLAVRTEFSSPEKKVNKIVMDLRNKLRNYFVKKVETTPASEDLTKIGLNLEFDDEINEIFLNLK